MRVFTGRRCRYVVLLLAMAVVMAMPVSSALGDESADAVRAYLQGSEARDAAAVLVSTGLEANGSDAAKVDADTIAWREVRRLREVRQSDDVQQSYLSDAVQHRWGVSVAVEGETVGVMTVDETDAGPAAATFYPDVMLAQCIDASSPDGDVVFDVPAYAVFSLEGERLSPMNDNAEKLLGEEEPVDEALHDIQRRKPLMDISTESGGTSTQSDIRQADDAEASSIPALSIAVGVVLGGAGIRLAVLRARTRKRSGHTR